MSKANLSGVFDEAQAAGRIRSELLQIQLDLDKGPKRTAARRAQSWSVIASESQKRVEALKNQEQPKQETQNEQLEARLHTAPPQSADPA